MATGLIKGNTVVGLKAESSEGTYIAPASSTDYTRVLDGIEVSPKREVIDRALITSSPGRPTPRLGLKTVSASVPVECRASGVEGAAPDYGLLLKSGLGAVRSCASNTTTKTGNTSTVLQIEDADISKFNVGDMVLVKESGAHEVRPISAKSSGTGTATITFPFALDNGAPSDNVVISKFSTYYTASSGHPSFSLSTYWANEIREAVIGGKVTAIALDNFQTGQVPSWKFGVEGLTFTNVDGAAPHTPSYDSGLPPLVLSACVWRAGVNTPINALGLSLSNQLGFITSTCSANGRTSSRVKQREITGSLNPYKDDTSVSYFDDWVAGTEFSLFAYAYIPSATAGEITMGSVVGLWLPQCITTDFKVGEQDGILVDDLSFRATRGSSGSNEEMYVGII